MAFISSLLFLLLLFSLSHGLDNAPWQEYIHSPSSRTPAPHSIYHVSGNATANRDGSTGTFILDMQPGSHISLDFGVELGGHISFAITTNSSHPVSLAFSESPEFVRPISDDTGAVPTENYDLALNITLLPHQTHYKTPPASFRGGFRFLTINAFAAVRITNVQCEVGFAPNMPDLRNYTGHFHASSPSDELLNRIWYAGAYTLQTNIAPQSTGRFLPQVKPGWAYNASLGVGDGPFLVDGAKRDRAIWPGDMGVSGPGAWLAFGPAGLEAWKNSLATLFFYQNATTGEFPFAGPDTASFHSGSQSETYHAWSLISIYDFSLYSGDTVWLKEHWGNISRGADYIVANLDPDTGLQNQTQPNDWGRQGGGGFNSALNALDYHALVVVSSLPGATAQQVSHWTAAAAKLKNSYNALLWDSTANLYRDNTTTMLHPQDGNSLALLYGLPLTSTQESSLSAALPRFWNQIGPVTPELPDTISPFVSGLELSAHYAAGQPARGLELLRRLWGYLIAAPQFTGSTLVEGLTANGSLYYRSTAGYNGDAAYTSLSHGWSAAPSQILIEEVLGFRLTDLGGRAWRLMPQVEGLDLGGGGVEGGFATALGQFSARIAEVSEWRMEVEIKTPEGTEGMVVVPPGWRRVEVDGRWCDEDGKVSGGTRSLVFYR